MGKEPTLGIKLITVFLVLFTIPVLLMAFIAAISGPPPSEKSHDPAEIRLLFVFTPFFYIAAAIGIALLKEWARVLTIVISIPAVLYLGSLAIKCITVLKTNPEYAASNIPFSIVLAVIALMHIVTIYYLLLSKAKEQFK